MSLLDKISKTAGKKEAAQTDSAAQMTVEMLQIKDQASKAQVQNNNETQQAQDCDTTTQAPSDVAQAQVEDRAEKEQTPNNGVQTQEQGRPLTAQAHLQNSDAALQAKDNATASQVQTQDNATEAQAPSDAAALQAQDDDAEEQAQNRSRASRSKNSALMGRIKNRGGAVLSRNNGAVRSRNNGTAQPQEGDAAALQSEDGDVAARVGARMGNQVENLLDVIDGTPVSQEQRVAQAAEIAGAYRQMRGGESRSARNLASAAIAPASSAAAGDPATAPAGDPAAAAATALAGDQTSSAFAGDPAAAGAPATALAGDPAAAAADASTALPTPDFDALVGELRRVKYRAKFWRVFRSTAGILVTVIAVAILVASLLMPVLRLYGSSMTPTLNNGDIVLSLKTSECKTGDVVAFYYNNKVLAKRVIATSGQWVNIAEDGTVFVNNKEIEEPYLTEKDMGDCNITLPYQVPEDKLFVMGDHRSVSVDSRNTSVGCVSSEQIVGKLVFTVWPLSQFGPIQQKSSGA